MIKHYLTYIGLWQDSSENLFSDEKYTPVFNKQIAEKYLKYLEDLSQYQKDRKQTIESKNSLLIGQASIVFSLVGLFIPLFNGQLAGHNFWLIVLATAIFLVAITHYILTISFAMKNLEINKMRYAVGSTTTVTKSGRNLREIDFLNEQIKDLVFVINYNIKQIDIIGDNLIHASRCFKVANFSFFTLTIVLIILLASGKEQTPKVEITNLKEIPCCDSTPKNIQSGLEYNLSSKLDAAFHFQNQRIESLFVKIDLMQKCRGPKTFIPHTPKQPCPCPCDVPAPKKTNSQND